MLKNRLWGALSVVFVLLLAFGLRFAYANYTVVDNPLRGDARYYSIYANNLIAHGVFSKDQENKPPVPDSYWSPGYPFFMALMARVAQAAGVNDYMFLLYAQAVLGALTALFTLLMARLFLSPAWALAPAILVAFSPHLVSIGGVLLTETLMSFLLLVSLYLFSLALLSNNKWLIAGTGICFGLAYLVNPVLFILPLLLTGGYLWLQKSKNESLSEASKFVAPLLICFFLLVGAWAVRDRISVPEGVASSSDRLLINLIIGSHSDFFDIWRANPRDPDNPATIDSAEMDGSIGKFAGVLAARIAASPGHYLNWYFLEKPLQLWSWSILVGAGDIYVYPVKRSLYSAWLPAVATYSVMKATHFWLFGFAVLGLVFVRVKDEGSARVPVILYTSLIYVSAVYVVTQSDPRYSVPLRPELYICAVFFLREAFVRLRKKSAESLE